MMLRPSLPEIITAIRDAEEKNKGSKLEPTAKPGGRNESYYALVIGVAKRAREIADQHVKEKEEAKAADERRAKAAGDTKVRPDDKMQRLVVLEENPVKTAVDEFAAGKFHIEESGSGEPA